MILALSRADMQLIQLIATVVSVVVGVAGVSAALWIALRAEDKRAQKRAPLLSFSVVPGNYFVDMRVDNAPGKDTARNVELLVIDVEHYPLASIAVPRGWTSVERVGQALEWFGGTRRINIPPGLTRDITVATVRGQAHMPDHAQASLDVAPFARVPIPGGERDLILTASHSLRSHLKNAPEDTKNAPARVRLALVADNSDAAYRTLEIGWPYDEDWTLTRSGGKFTTKLLPEDASSVKTQGLTKRALVFIRCVKVYVRGLRRGSGS